MTDVKLNMCALFKTGIVLELNACFQCKKIVYLNLNLKNLNLKSEFVLKVNIWWSKWGR